MFVIVLQRKVIEKFEIQICYHDTEKSRGDENEKKKKK